MNFLANCLVLVSVAVFCVRVQSQNCALEGYDVGTLSEANYWTARVDDPKHCLLPLGYQLDDVVSCDIYFSVCKPLRTVCPGFENSSSCQEVMTSNGNKTYFDMGDFNPNQPFKALGGEETGFSVPRQTAKSVVSGDCNNKTVFSVTTFICEADSKWDPNDNNVTVYLDFVKEVFSIGCVYAIQFRYVGGCETAPTLSPSDCTLDEYDTATLKSKEYWLASKDSAVCFDSTVTSCKLYISFCHSIPLSIGSGCNGSSVCQISSKEPKGLSLGASANFTTFHENEKGTTGGFYMKVESGSRSETCPNGISTQVTLTCDSSKSWNHQDISSYVQVTYQQPCNFMFEIGYKGACIKERPIANSSLPSPFGWILIGIVAIAVISYLSVGVVYNRLKKGATGLQLIPHYDFWFNVLVLVLEGCYFFLGMITCFKFDGKLKMVRQPNYDKI